MCETCGDTGVVILKDGAIAVFQKCTDCDRTEQNEKRWAWMRKLIRDWERGVI